MMTIPESWLWVATLFAASLVLKLTLKLTLQDRSKAWEDQVWNAGIFAFAVWKLSPLIESFEQVSQEPLALLYLPGTLAGTFAGGVLLLGWLGWQIAQRPHGRTAAPALATSLLAAALAAGLVIGAAALVPRPQPLVIASSVRLPTLSGEEQNVGVSPGRVTIVNFWATWCPPCRAEIPEFVAFWQKADQSRVAIQAVDLWTSEREPALVAPFVATHGMRFPVLLDQQGDAARVYQIESIPTTIVFDPEGKLVVRHVGVLTRERLQALVDQYGR